MARCWRQALLAALAPIAPAVCVACLASAQEPCRTVPLEAATVFLEDTEPVYSRIFAGTLEEVAPPEGLSPGRLRVRLDDGAGQTVFFQHLDAAIRLPVGRPLSFQVDQVAGFPSLYGIVVSDERGLLLAAASDLRPGQGVLRGGVPGFEIRFTESSCAARVRSDCYEEITNLPLRFTHGNSSLTLMQSESGRLGDYEIDCLTAQRVVYSEGCADAGIVAVSYIITRSDLVAGAGQSTDP